MSASRFALSWLVRDNTHCSEFAGRIFTDAEGGKEVLPVRGVEFRLAYRYARDRGWLDAAAELSPLLNAFLQVEPDWPPRIRRAINFCERASQTIFLLESQPRLVTGLEALAPPSGRRIVVLTVLTAIVASFWTWGGWSFFVAVGTIGLALGTGWLAWNTREAVRESRRQIDLSSREVVAVEAQGKAIAEQTQAVRDQATATERQVAISAASLEAAARPVLVGVVPPPVYRAGRQRVDAEVETVSYWKDHDASVERDRVYYEETDEMIYCSVPLRNVGAGVAFVQRNNRG
jgi:hypothetical protein